MGLEESHNWEIELNYVGDDKISTYKCDHYEVRNGFIELHLIKNKRIMYTPTNGISFIQAKYIDTYTDKHGRVFYKENN